jgi:hypothetical protein
MVAGFQDCAAFHPVVSLPTLPPSLPPPPSLARSCNPDAFVAGRDLTNSNGINSAIGFRKLMVCGLDRFTWSLQAVTSFEPSCWSFVCRCAGSDWKFVATNGTTTTQNPTSNLARPVTQPQAHKVQLARMHRNNGETSVPSGSRTGGFRMHKQYRAGSEATTLRTKPSR